jgi:hypothetical protein
MRLSVWGTLTDSSLRARKLSQDERQLWRALPISLEEASRVLLKISVNRAPSIARDLAARNGSSGAELRKPLYIFRGDLPLPQRKVYAQRWYPGRALRSPRTGCWPLSLNRAK